MKHYLIKLDNYASINPFNNVYAIGRSMLAFSLLITFLFSPIDVLFDKYLFHKVTIDTFLDTTNLFFLLGFDNLWIGKVITLLICLGVIIGYYPCITGILHWWVTFSFQQSGSILEGGDQIASIITLLLVPVTVVDNRNNHWNHTIIRTSVFKNFFALVPLEIIRIQMAVLYLQAGTEKLYKVVEWQNGTALYYYLKDPLFGYPLWAGYFFEPLLAEPFLISLFTWSVPIFEITLFGALFMKDSLRLKILPLALLFHILIALLIGLWSFSFAMFGGIVLYLISYKKPFYFKSLWNQK